MPKRRTTRVYWKGGRAYGDFRDLGGRLEALIPPEERVGGKRGRATTDPDVAAKLAANRVKELTEKRKNVALGIEEKKPAPALGVYAARHLILKKKKGEATDAWLSAMERHFKEACAFFGEERPLDRIDPEDLTAWVEHLRAKPGRRGQSMAEGTVRKHLNSVSNLYARAVSEKRKTGVATNPVADMFEKPTAETPEARYLAPEEAAILLESARTYRADAEQGAFQYMHPLLATLLLTGGRRSEVLGLMVDDVSLSLGKVYIRPNRFRRLKTKGSARTVPLHPQLRAILEEYFAEREQEGGLGTGLLFPAVVTEEQKKKAAAKGQTVPERMLVDLRKPLARIAERAGFTEPVLLHSLRHTYTAARIQTCDRGVPIAAYTVARELGHTSTVMIERVYGHLHDRAQAGGTEVVEYRIEHHRERLADRLEALTMAPARL